MKKNDILLRARNYDLTESELDALHSDSSKLEALYDDVLIDNITEDLFIPGQKELIAQKRNEIENLTRGLQPQKTKSVILSMKFIGIAASVLILCGAIFLLKPHSGELSDKQIAEFKEISRLSYSPHVIASIERSAENDANRELVTAYIEEDYNLILTKTSQELENAEMKLLRARVLMNLERYEEGYEIMKSLNEEELIQKDVYLWMMAEGALGVRDEDFFNYLKKLIIIKKLPGSAKFNIKI